MTNQIGVRYAGGRVQALRFEELAEGTVIKFPAPAALDETEIVGRLDFPEEVCLMEACEGSKFPTRGRVSEQSQLARDLQAFDEAIRDGASEEEAFNAAICGYKPNAG